MKIPVTPPTFENMKLEDQLKLMHPPFLMVKPTIKKGEYIHWDILRHLTPPQGYTSDQWWLGIKIARRALYKSLPFTDKYGNPFQFATPDEVLQKLHKIDRNIGNTVIQNHPVVFDSQIRDTYLIQSLIEEAITSSQLEGASTTRNVAKEMLRTQRRPRNVSEQMILNNYEAMNFIREVKNQSLTINLILEIHRILTKDIINQSPGYLRKESDDIHVWDNKDTILHTPPKAEELKVRLKRLCDFANVTEDQENMFIHPVIKAIILHFVLAYDHPFTDGNGRTARALFYWSLLHQGYELIEFISISHILKKAPSQYANAFLYTETDDNDVTYFIVQQLNVILEAIKSLYSYLEKQNKEISETEELLQAIRDKINYRQIMLIKHAIKHPKMQYLIDIHKRSHNVTYDTARTDLLNLVKLGLLIKKKKGKAFIFVPTPDLKKKIEHLEDQS